MFYHASLRQEDGQWLADFRDVPGCQTFGSSRDEALKEAREALEGWLEACLSLGRVPPRPSSRAGDPIYLAPRLASALSIRWARDERGMSQKDLAERAGVKQQQIAKLEDPTANPTIASLEKVARALDQRLALALFDTSLAREPSIEVPNIRWGGFHRGAEVTAGRSTRRAASTSTRKTKTA